MDMVLILHFQSERDGPGPDEVTVSFQKSVPMSTYLVVFIVSDFLSLTTQNVPNNGKNLPIRVLATPQQVPYTDLALNTARQVTTFYLDYFKIPYPLPKLGKSMDPPIGYELFTESDTALKTRIG